MNNEERKVQKGDKFRWGESVVVEVTRVHKNGFWADLSCTVNIGSKSTNWTKRQRLPFPSTFVLIEEA